MSLPKSTMESTFRWLVSIGFAFIIFLGVINQITPNMLLDSSELSSVHVLTETDSLDNDQLRAIGLLAADRKILSIQDLWNFERSFYQVLISVLIALNAFVGTFAFLLVRSSSNAAAIDTAKKESSRVAQETVDIYISSERFRTALEKSAESALNDSGYQTDYVFLSKTLEELAEQHDAIEKRFNRDSEDIKRWINLISHKIALMDSERDSSTLEKKHVEEVRSDKLKLVESEREAPVGED
ncbi:hypothetical protein [Shewanella litorisediminis]|uniref:Uncharacterized protein n=2 Tax=Shewanella litorisediminis TaxID=1173586 RepID=A0ABX7G2G9_9GAMM|nr:hypothetical protein [Shewanella litorisediminis]QRH01524.1 hypothetical protein JQC75_17010 [Shewanella litorisediminis]